MSGKLAERIEELRRFSRDENHSVVQQNTYSNHLDDLLNAKLDEILAAIPRNEKGIEVVSDFFKSLNFGQ